MTATDVARGFSEVLDRVAAGEEIEVTRRGTPVALIAPSRGGLVSAERFRELIATAPHLDEQFAKELHRIRESSGSPRKPWQ